MDRRFRLQSVLNYRQNREDVLQLELARLQAEELAARRQLDELRAESDRAIGDARVFLEQPIVNVAAVQQGFVYLDAVLGAIARQGRIVGELSERMETKRRELVAAMQDRKVLENLKQRHDRAYAEWARQAEQRAVDDMVSARYARRLATGEVSSP